MRSRNLGMLGEVEASNDKVLLEVEMLLTMFIARRMIESATNGLLTCARALNRPRPSSAIKLIERGWSHIDTTLCSKISQEATSIFMTKLAELEKREENASRGDGESRTASEVGGGAPSIDSLPEHAHDGRGDVGVESSSGGGVDDISSQDAEAAR